MMALGNRSRQVFGMIVTESVVLALLGGCLGVAIGIMLAFAISAVGIPMPPPPNADVGYTARIQITLAATLMAFAIGFIATVLASILPARRVTSTPVGDALRQNI